MLNKYPTIMIPTATIPTKVKIKGNFRTLRSIIISGSDKPITAIMKAREVPNDAPFSISTDTIGTIPAALEYNGIPIKIDNGTEYHADLPMSAAINSSGT
jgi:hypothetical protein